MNRLEANERAANEETIRSLRVQVVELSAKYEHASAKASAYLGAAMKLLAAIAAVRRNIATVTSLTSGQYSVVRDAVDSAKKIISDYGGSTS